jgi:hypothetical protein
MGWKKFAETEKGAAGQVERESHVDFFYIEGVVHHEFLREGQTVNRWYYLEVLKRLTENVKKKKTELWKNNSWFLHHENAPANASLLIRDFLPKRTQLCFLSHPNHLTWLRQTFSFFPNLNPL